MKLYHLAFGQTLWLIRQNCHCMSYCFVKGNAFQHADLRHCRQIEGLTNYLPYLITCIEVFFCLYYLNAYIYYHISVRLTHTCVVEVTLPLLLGDRLSINQSHMQQQERCVVGKLRIVFSRSSFWYRKMLVAWDDTCCKTNDLENHWSNIQF